MYRTETGIRGDGVNENENEKNKRDKIRTAIAKGDKEDECFEDNNC